MIFESQILSGEVTGKSTRIVTHWFWLMLKGTVKNWLTLITRKHNNQEKALKHLKLQCQKTDNSKLPLLQELIMRWDSERELFLRQYCTHTSKYQKKRTYLQQISWQLGKYCALSLEFMNLIQNFHLAVIEYLYRGRRAVPLQTFTTGHSNRKLSIVMALSTTFTKCARKPNSVK